MHIAASYVEKLIFLMLVITYDAVYFLLSSLNYFIIIIVIIIDASV